jgi:hypothetical protein
MQKSLETIATFANVADAHIVKNHLEEEGIPAFLADENTVFNFGYLSNALGGIKLQVQPEHTEQALDILRSAQHLDPGATASESSPDAKEELSNAETGSRDVDESPDEPEVPLNAREEMAERAFRAAGLGFLFFPFEFYALWQLLKVAFSDLPLNPTAQRRALIAAGLSVPMVLLVLWGAIFLLDDFWPRPT